MAVRPQRSWGRIALQALAAGIAGGALLDAFLWLMLLRPAGVPITGLFTLAATDAMGPGVAGNPNVALIGACVHFAVSIGWAGAYAYVASTRTFLNARWAVSGIVYGVVVYLLMQIVLLTAGHFEYPHSPNDFVIMLVAHAVFFGLPVAYVVKLLDRG